MTAFSQNELEICFYWGCPQAGGIWGAELDVKHSVKAVPNPVKSFHSICDNYSIHSAAETGGGLAVFLVDQAGHGFRSFEPAPPAMSNNLQSASLIRRRAWRSRRSAIFWGIARPMYLRKASCKRRPDMGTCAATSP